MSARSVLREAQIKLGGLQIHVQYKQVKNLTLRLKPDASIWLTVPLGLDRLEIERFLFKREPWLRKKLQLLDERQQAEQYVMGELPYDGWSVWVWGERRTISFQLAAPADCGYEVTKQGVVARLPFQPTEAQKPLVVEKFYESQVLQLGEAFLRMREERMGVRHTGLKVHRMKTRWGSCNVRTGGINLNTLLACWPLPCLEYIVVHELTHLLERPHSARFHELVARFLPQWREYEQLLKTFKPF